MFARMRLRNTSWASVVAGAALLASTGETFGQSQAKGGRGAGQNQSMRLDDIKIQSKAVAVPVNPRDPIAIINGQAITRQQLADECVAREGSKVLDTMINRLIIEQALKMRSLEVTPAEVEQEIENTAARFGISREAWLRTLDKEKKITPLQYARDIIQPALALRKLCAGRVQITPKDMQNAFEAQFGDKLRVRMILVDKQSTGFEIWEELRKNPGGFEKLAQERSLDTGSRAIGGLMAEPITRHAYPETVSDAAFRQLVDGDPKDNNPNHKPKDGDFTGPIQVAESAWVILRRESIIPAQKGVDLRDERVKKQTYEMIYDVKLKEAMGDVFTELMKSASIQNLLTGSVKLANEEHTEEYKRAQADVDGQVKLMSNPNAAVPQGEKASAAAGAGAVPDPSTLPRQKIPAPAAVSPQAAQQFDSITGRGSPR